MIEVFGGFKTWWCILLDCIAVCRRILTSRDGECGGEVWQVVVEMHCFFQKLSEDSYI